jgi:6-phosphofructokinase 1
VTALSPDEVKIEALGPCGIESPLVRQSAGEKTFHFISDEARVLFDDRADRVAASVAAGEPLAAFEMAGPREKIFFDPAKAAAAIVTCGGLCPGLNDVIRGIVMELSYLYGVSRIYGIRYGYEGFVQEYGHTIVPLKPGSVANIHMLGGTILGTSRGAQDIGTIANMLEEMNVQMLFVIGGDGSLRGALDISQELQRRGRRIAVVGIPKTIDNDIMYLDKSFGFETAFAEAVKSISCAHTEAVGSLNGVGLVKLMGRHSGFIACFAALAHDVNFVLIPEVPFALDGENGLLEHLRRRLEVRRHAVIVVAEGAGQEYFSENHGTDASGNVRLEDIGVFLKRRIDSYFKQLRREVNVKYFDPSYLVRSVPASPQDGVYCSRLAQNAVHAAMAGKTGMVVGRWHGRYVHLPIKLTTSGRKRVDPDGDLWLSVLEATRQPMRFH